MPDLLYFFVSLVCLVAGGELDGHGIDVRSVRGIGIGVRIDAEVGGIAAEVGVDVAGVVVVVVDVSVIVNDVVGVVGVVVVVVVVAVGNIVQSVGDERLKAAGG